MIAGRSLTLRRARLFFPRSNDPVGQERDVTGQLSERAPFRAARSGLKPNDLIIVSAAKGRFRRSTRTGYEVTGYRLYGLDGVRKVASGEWFEADDDETAIETAKNMMDGHECELWQGRRLVARLDRQER